MIEKPDTWVIEPRNEKLAARLSECWRHRKLLTFFAVKAFRKTYARTVLGWGWLLIKPLAPIIVASFLFGSLLRVPSGGVPYFLFFLVGLTPWLLFESSWMWATRSLELNRKILDKAYVPRMLIPVASVAPAILDFFIYSALIVCTTIYFLLKDGQMFVVLGAGLLIGLGITILVILAALALGLWTAVWGAQIRDVRFTLRYVLQIWFMLTPVIYPLSMVPESWRWISLLNPMTPIVETFRWSILAVGSPMWTELSGAVVGLLAVGMVGLWYFGRAETLALE